MAFSENLSYLRKKSELTQEQLAEQLGVSRQAVSKWEAGASYPEMDKMLLLCKLFSCSMDDLALADISQQDREDIAGYDAFQNRTSLYMALGVGLLILGAAAMMLFRAFASMEIGLIALFGFVAIALPIFIFHGIAMEQFEKKNPVIEDFYTPAKKERYQHIFAVGMSLAMGLLFLGVMLIIALPMLGASIDAAVGALLLCAAAAVSAFVYLGMQKDKYDIEKYNKKQRQRERQKQSEEQSGIVCGAIMMTATAVFLLLGFLFGKWHPGWVVFPVGGIACGIVASVMENKKK